MTTELTTIETRLVERYVWVLDLMSRCAQAIDAGDWYYLADKAGDLAARAERLAEVAGEIAQAVRDGRRGRPRAQVVRAAVALYGRHYRAGRLLHPAGDHDEGAPHDR
jgi:outer membrane protein TolC